MACGLVPDRRWSPRCRWAAGRSALDPLGDVPICHAATMATGQPAPHKAGSPQPRLRAVRDLRQRMRGRAAVPSSPPALPDRQFVAIVRLDAAQPRAPPVRLVAAAQPRGPPSADLSLALPPRATAPALPTHISGVLQSCTVQALLAALAGASLLASEPAFAHGFAGPHMFISTLIIDDPNVADEASRCRPSRSCRSRPTADRCQSSTRLNFEFDKRITENFGFSHQRRLPVAAHARREDRQRLGELLDATLKYKPYVNAEHEFMMSVGVFARLRTHRRDRHQRCGAGQRRQQFHRRRRSTGARASAICRSAGLRAVRAHRRRWATRSPTRN